MTLKSTYDQDGDILYIQFSTAKVDRTKSLDDLRLVDYARNGSPIGVEFIGASGGLDLKDVPRSEEIAALVSAKKLDFPILVN